jgi:prophage maintenance system killer protein
MSRYQYNELFTALGFSWDRSVVPTDIPAYTRSRAIADFEHRLALFVWSALRYEANKIPYYKVNKMIGQSIGGSRDPELSPSDFEQAQNYVKAAKCLVRMLWGGVFSLSKQTFCDLQGIVAEKEALEWGILRGEGSIISTTSVSLSHGRMYYPHPTLSGAPDLNLVLANSLNYLNELPPFERALVVFLFGAYHQFFYDGNKRTSRLMMNGILLSHGINAISIPVSRENEFNNKMVDFYISADATEMIRFLVDCHPESEQIWASNPSCLPSI